MPRLHRPVLTVKLKHEDEAETAVGRRCLGREPETIHHAPASDARRPAADDLLKNKGPRLVGDSQGPLGQGGTGLPDRTAPTLYPDSQLKSAFIFHATV